MTIFERYRTAPGEWIEPRSGVVVEPMARLVVSRNMIAVEHTFSEAFDRKVHDLPEDDDESAAPSVGGRRGEITEFTAASRARLVKRLACWNTEGRLFVVTLTYPSVFPTPARAQEDFKRFRRALREEFPYLRGLWKLEYQTRGAVHYHMVLEGGDEPGASINLFTFREWMDEAWRKARKSAVHARTQVEYERSPEKAKFYLTKEVGKTVQCSAAWKAKVRQDDARGRLEAEEIGEDDPHRHVGRFWGWHGKDRLKFEAREIVMPAATLWVVRRRVQELVAQDMVRRGQLKFDGDKLVRLDGSEFDESGLPAWQLFADAPEVLKVVLESLRTQGIEVPDLDQFQVTEDPYG